MTDRERLAALIEQLPEDHLRLALERLEPLVKTSNLIQSGAPEAAEFVIHDLPPRRIRLPLRVHAREPREKVVMEIGDKSEAAAGAVNALSANARWWSDHRAEIVAAYHNTHIAISQGEIFQGESYFDALAQARAKHPADTPLVIRLFNLLPASGMNRNAN